MSFAFKLVVKYIPAIASYKLNQYIMNDTFSSVAIIAMLTWLFNLLPVSGPVKSVVNAIAFIGALALVVVKELVK